MAAGGADARSKRADPVWPVTAGGAARAEASVAAGGETRADRWRRRMRDPAIGRPVWWVEIAILLVLYYAYTATRGFADGSEAEAVRAGETLLRWQEALGLDIELGLNRWLHDVPALAVLCCYYYATLHFVVTPAVIVWLHIRHPRSYSRARWALVTTTVVCLIVFYVVPMAPPRLLPDAGFTDTMAYYHDWGWWSGNASAAPNGLDELANQYAAMPSLHCAWALWCGVLLARHARWRWVRVLGALYPAGTAFVVMATANHYLLDAVAGWLVLAFAAVAATALTRWTTSRAASRAAAAPVGPAEAVGAGQPVPVEAVGAQATQPAPATATATVVVPRQS